MKSIKTSVANFITGIRLANATRCLSNLMVRCPKYVPEPDVMVSEILDMFDDAQRLIGFKAANALSGFRFKKHV